MNTAERLVASLIAKNLIIATAESCTGGMIASAIVDVPDASRVLYEGIVTYSNQSKQERLGVRADTLVQFGAVSSETATEMAEGLLAHADIGVATTGIAGPKGGTAEKPVGLVYIAVAGGLGTKVCMNRFSGGRQEIRTQAKNTALNMLLDYIKQI